MLPSLRIFTSTIRLAPRQFNSPIIQGPIIGVDLGTFNSRVAVMLDGKNVKIIENADGTRAIPSYVTYAGDNEWIVGAEAKRQAAKNSQNTLYATKRFIGRQYRDPGVQQFVMNSPFKIIENEDGKAAFEVQGKIYSSPQISAQMLMKLKESAEKYLGIKVENAVLTVPSYFNHSQKEATKESFKLAGLNVICTIKESTAAALAYGIDDKIIAVCDFGGGTFDISILEFKNGVYKEKSTKSDIFLGGEDFDNRLVWHLVDKFKRKYFVNLSNNPIAMHRLKVAAEEAKCELSLKTETVIDLQKINTKFYGAKNLDVKITREQYEKVVDDLIQRIKEPCQNALNDAGIKASDINEILLVGGMSQMPKVQKLVHEIFGCEPYVPANPDEAVVRGAAIHGYLLVGKNTDKVFKNESAKESAERWKPEKERDADPADWWRNPAERRMALLKAYLYFYLYQCLWFGIPLLVIKFIIWREENEVKHA